MRKTVLLYPLIFLIVGLCSAQAFAEDDPLRQAEMFHNRSEQMLKRPDLVTPDSIHTTNELKALYHQNLRIIALLKEIENLLRKQLLLAEKVAKAEE